MITPSLSFRALGDSWILRVLTLMGTPYHLLPTRLDQLERLELGWRLLREELSSTPWHKMKVEKLLAEGLNEPDYWKRLWSSHVNCLSRYENLFTVETPTAHLARVPPVGSSSRTQPVASAAH